MMTMLRKFRQFREKLTYKQLNRILLIAGIIIAIAYVAWLILLKPWESYTKEDPFPVVAVMTWFFIELGLLGLIWLLLGGINQEVIHESEQAESRLNEKLKGNEEVEVYFMPSEIGGNVKEYLKAPYEIFGLTYLAHKEGDKFVVRLMQGEKELWNDEIENACFFEHNFKFPEPKEKE